MLLFHAYCHIDFVKFGEKNNQLPAGKSPYGMTIHIELVVFHGFIGHATHTNQPKPESLVLVHASHN